ncbi:MAG: hypothetical protein AAFV53_37785, partial [Myxococcota bacterium]
MTRIKYLVTMTQWTVDNFKAELQEILGALDGLSDERQAIRRRIMAVASEHFSRFGYRRANIGDIARDAG